MEFSTEELGLVLASVNTRVKIIEERANRLPDYAKVVEPHLCKLKALQGRLLEWADSTTNLPEGINVPDAEDKERGRSGFDLRPDGPERNP